VLIYLRQRRRKAQRRERMMRCLDFAVRQENGEFEALRAS
jgi:hypothetical protein